MTEPRQQVDLPCRRRHNQQPGACPPWLSALLMLAFVAVTLAAFHRCGQVAHRQQPGNEPVAAALQQHYSASSGERAGATAAPVSAFGMNGGGGWIRTNVGLRRQIYSLLASPRPAPSVGQPLDSTAQSRSVVPVAVPRGAATALQRHYSVADRRSRSGARMEAP